MLLLVLKCSSLSSAFLLGLKLSSLFEAVCSLCSHFFWFLFRAVCVFFRKLASFFRLVCSLFLVSVGSFEWFALCSQNLKSFSSGLLLVLKFSSHFRAAGLFTNKTLVPFERFARCSQTLQVCFERFVPSSLGEVCSLFSTAFVFVQWFAFLFCPLRVVWSIASNPFSLIPKFSSLFRVVCSFFCYLFRVCLLLALTLSSLVPFEWFASLSQCI